MHDIVKTSLTRNGNGSINGRGVLRWKLSHEQRVSLATDVALGLVHVEPSMKQAAATVGVRPDEIREELKARAAAGERERQAEYARQGALSIVSAWDHATAEGRAEAIRLIGVANVWDVLAHVVG